MDSIRGFVENYSPVPSPLERIFIPPTGNPRTFHPSRLKERLERHGLPAVTARSVKQALALARQKAGRNGIVLVFGSFFLAGPAYEALGIEP